MITMHPITREIQIEIKINAEIGRGIEIETEITAENETVIEDTTERTIILLGTMIVVAKEITEAGTTTTFDPLHTAGETGDAAATAAAADTITGTHPIEKIGKGAKTRAFAPFEYTYHITEYL